ncbi:aminotransferase class I/II-fold pyridoxal phosphate-dependent enzyme [Niabella yanshanensis]|uniref:Aminotransferase class I/II-fold pyridoxal phosphate-dependent enzyme n=1 Tax=Niabella yanshanensis TaxID=577386 RepID=A0ABZ0W9Y4_9BACT|nr:aminotransferase class I/II-fold pyridoxal phosphate-dependent enzyme [Niabella yanshanensis]WQD39996.1 aminotransferase class I/II-fold pyridoxal phosphate-dependent enzyme [Niabella yanshanensis]
MTGKNIKGLATAAIHACGNSLPEHAHVMPIFATSSFTFDNAAQGMARFSGEEKGYTYSRFGNPTTDTAAKLIADLEAFGATDENGNTLEAWGLLTASGQAAMSTMIMANVSAGDTILSSQSLYGGTQEFFSGILPRFGVTCISLDLNNAELLEATLQQTPSIRLIHLETPANPGMQCIDIAAVSALAKKFDVLVTVDNTFATPYLQQPFKLGADLIFHSTTKFLNGHGSAIGGVILGKDQQSFQKVYPTYKLLGANANPFDAFLLLQGIKTLATRMDKHCDNAEAVARFLQQHSAVLKVNYNGLETHPDYQLCRSQMRRAGAVLSFELKDGFEEAVHFIDRLQIFVRAVSLGTTDSLISHPASMSHAAVAKEQRLKAGITDGLVRMSVGLEDITDLIADLEQALR